MCVLSPAPSLLSLKSCPHSPPFTVSYGVFLHCVSYSAFPLLVSHCFPTVFLSFFLGLHSFLPCLVPTRVLNLPPLLFHSAPFQKSVQSHPPGPSLGPTLFRSAPPGGPPLPLLLCPTLCPTLPSFPCVPTLGSFLCVLHVPTFLLFPGSSPCVLHCVLSAPSPGVLLAKTFPWFPTLCPNFASYWVPTQISHSPPFTVSYCGSFMGPTLFPTWSKNPPPSLVPHSKAPTLPPSPCPTFVLHLGSYSRLPFNVPTVCPRGCPTLVHSSSFTGPFSVLTLPPHCVLLCLLYCVLICVHCVSYPSFLHWSYSNLLFGPPFPCGPNLGAFTFVS
ncbi:hypothetical protein PBY51_016558 [Eleginops maclovinus]|uniref:Uncharacterized protein n=1 Tax=Eleginops maclovinus TaxID=56733 RepID=A0AAN7WRC5_ELEMC|nr:hypothetical protein PBY51_016558 [Eleginops maclovinus]